MMKMKLLGDKRLAKKFAKLVGRSLAGTKTWYVGFDAEYAIYVHEMVGANVQAPGTQAKFLEKHIRDKKGEVGNIVNFQYFSINKPFGQAIYVGALFLQRESQKITPIDTGFLRGSAFTREQP